eukprot:COSAG01_NODE_15274_length_1355_cov_2.738057_1_plen_145_part_00
MGNPALTPSDHANAVCSVGAFTAARRQLLVAQRGENRYNITRRRQSRQAQRQRFLANKQEESVRVAQGLRELLVLDIGAVDVFYLWGCAWGGVAALLQPARVTLRAEASEFVPLHKERAESPVMEAPDEPARMTPTRQQRLEMN